MAGLTKNKLCCTLDIFFKRKSKIYCLTCFKDSIKENLRKKIDYDKVPHWIAKAQKNYLLDSSHFDAWEEMLDFDHEDDFERALDFACNKVIGPTYQADLLDDEVIDAAYEARAELLTKAEKRVKIVVEPL